MATNGEKKVSEGDARSLAEKLQVFRETLSPGEQRALDSTLQVFEDRLGDPSVRALLEEFPESSQILEDVAGFRAPGEEEIVWTTVTLTTVAASHPIITC